jgi:hypothetical protein
MGAHLRGGLPAREGRSVTEHLRRCAGCKVVFLELSDVDRGLRVVIGPLICGPALGGYLAALGRTGPGAVRGIVGWWRGMPAWQAGVGITAVSAALFLLIPTVLLASADREGESSLPRARAPLPVPLPPVVPAVPRTEPRFVPRPGPEPERPAPAAVPAGSSRLVASIGPVGALVRGQPGIVAIRLRNAGERSTGEIRAFIELPPGVAARTARRPGDGWSCRTRSGGLRCLRRSLLPGRDTAAFLRVAVAPDAPGGRPLHLRVTGGGGRISAAAGSGVRADGAAARFAADGRLTARSVGNGLVTCQQARFGCEMARRRIRGYRDNDLWSMRPLDQDSDPSTSSSSAARLDLPERADIVWAGLYWSATVPGDLLARHAVPGIRLRPPGAGRYATVKAAEVGYRDLPAGIAYQAFSDVTGLVRRTGRSGGRWWAADAPLRPGVSAHAGWALVVVVADRRLPYGRVAVLDRATVVGGGHDTMDIPLDGLRQASPPGRSTPPARLDMVAWDGDADLTGDAVLLDGRALRPEGGDRDPGNAFDGSATGALGGGDTFGTEVDTFRPRLRPQSLLLVSTQEDVLLFGVAAITVSTGF